MNPTGHKCPHCTGEHYEASPSELRRHIYIEHKEHYDWKGVNDAIAGVSFKAAEPTDEPGELMAAMMPLLKHMPVPEIVKDKVSCPVCGQACQARPQMLRQAAEIYGGRMIPVCSECSLIAHTSKPTLVLWLREKGKTPGQVLAEVLSQAEGGGKPE